MKATYVDVEVIRHAHGDQLPQHEDLPRYIQDRHLVHHPREELGLELQFCGVRVERVPACVGFRA
jgi:hypothetical protein